MKPLRVLFVVKNTASAFQRDQRNMGLFSYAVPEFEWQHLAMPKGGEIDKSLYKDDFDLIFHEDAPGCTYKGDALPLVYYAIDSTLTHDHHYLPRLEQARYANLVLVDHDKLGRFNMADAPTRRLSYCVNNFLFYDRGLERSLDIVFHCPAGNHVPGGDERRHVRQLLHEYAERWNHTYVSGAVDVLTYAKHFAQAKIVVSWSRTITNRPHRIMDATASGAALLSSPFPVNDEGWIPGDHYVRAKTMEDIEGWLDHMWDDTDLCVYYRDIARAGEEHTLNNHTWAIRARQLRQIISEELHL